MVRVDAIRCSSEQTSALNLMHWHRNSTDVRVGYGGVGAGTSRVQPDAGEGVEGEREWLMVIFETSILSDIMVG